MHSSSRVIRGAGGCVLLRHGACPMDVSSVLDGSLLMWKQLSPAMPRAPSSLQQLTVH